LFEVDRDQKRIRDKGWEQIKVQKNCKGGRERMSNADTKEVISR
jgi:hypothetical protein